MKPVNVGLVGLGTVGSGIVNIFNKNAALLSKRAHCSLQLSHIGARRDNELCDTSAYRVSRDIFEVVNDPDVDVLIEVIGGITIAKDVITQALKAKKHVVTANKALIAEYGDELFELANQSGVALKYEAAVAGSIPIIKTLTEGLSGNEVSSVVGIINGTGNFILSEMTSKGREFADVLKEAQDLGYAEADPTFDVEGIDAAHKLQILASLAFGSWFKMGSVSTEGISKVAPKDIAYASELGYRIKHLGIARQTSEGCELRVHPTLINVSESIAKVDGALNAVYLNGDAAGGALSVGAGAGSLPTASAVVADVIDVAKCGSAATSAVDFEGERQVLPLDQCRSAYYVRFVAIDRPGVMSEVAQAFSKCDISLEAILQKEKRQSSDDVVDVVLITNTVKEASFNQAISALKSNGAVVGDIQRIRVETQF